jgi:hypothetical protein
MSDRQDAKMIVGDEIGNVVRESRDRRSPNFELRDETLGRCARARPVPEQSDRCLDRVNEGIAEARPLLLVPSRRVLEL